MKLFVIVLCLFIERFFVHASSNNRFQWFSHYGKALEKRLSLWPFLSSPSVMLTAIIMPLIVLLNVVFYFLSDSLFGLLGVILNVVVFYYCIGPENPFYPVRVNTEDTANEKEVGAYLTNVNRQLFAVLFWYILVGPVTLAFYRLVSLSQNFRLAGLAAAWLTNLLEWMPARMTILLYLLVGNFQAGVRHYSKLLFTAPSENQLLLGECSAQALGCKTSEPVFMPSAENLVEHALILLLVFVALFTLIAWI